MKYFSHFIQICFEQVEKLISEANEKWIEQNERKLGWPQNVDKICSRTLFRKPNTRQGNWQLIEALLTLSGNLWFAWL